MPNGHDNTLEAVAPVRITDTGSAFDRGDRPDGSRASLGFDAQGIARAFDQEVARPIRALANKTIDEVSILSGLVLPGSIADKVVDAYRKHLFGDATLQALPAEPRFVINATNVQSGALWRFSRPYMADYRVGMVQNPTVELAIAVAASAAFPPVLSPLRLEGGRLAVRAPERPAL